MKITIYGASWCVGSLKSKKLCEEKHIEYEFFDFSKEPESFNQLVVRLGKQPSTIPKIFDKDTLIGGFIELEEYLNHY